MSDKNKITLAAKTKAGSGDDELMKPEEKKPDLFHDERLFDLSQEKDFNELKKIFGDQA